MENLQPTEDIEQKKTSRKKTSVSVLATKKQYSDRLKKHSSVVQITNTVTVFQRRLFNILLANAQREKQKNINRHKIYIGEISSLLHNNSENYDFIYQSLQALVSTSVQWNFLRKDKRHQEIWTRLNEEYNAGLGPRGGAALLAQWEHEGNGVISYEFPSVITGLILNPPMYALLSLKMQNQFDDKHSLALYELFTDYFNAEFPDRSMTPVMSVHDVRIVMGVADNEYSDEFKNVSRDIIKRSIAEIEDKTELRIEALYQKRGHTVVSVQFLIGKVQRHQAPKVEQLLLPLETETPASQVSEPLIDYDALFESLSLEERGIILREAELQMPHFARNPSTEAEHKVYQTYFMPIRNKILFDVLPDQM